MTIPDLTSHPRRDTPFGPVHLCGHNHPMPKGGDQPGIRWEHADVHEVGDQEDGWPGGDWQKYECRCCGHTWKAELPQ